MKIEVIDLRKRFQEEKKRDFKMYKSRFKKRKFNIDTRGTEL